MYCSGYSAHRELVSQLFSVSYPDILSASMIGKGFERLFELADELEKDVPTARDNIATFLARCVVDEGQWCNQCFLKLMAVE